MSVSLVSGVRMRLDSPDKVLTGATLGMPGGTLFMAPSDFAQGTNPQSAGMGLNHSVQDLP